MSGSSLPSIFAPAHFTLVLAASVPGQHVPGSRPGELAEVHKQGTGDRTLVLLPCMAGRWRTYDTFMERNAKRYTMYAVTVPGYGGTPFPDLPRNGPGTPFRDNALAGLEKLFRDEKIKHAVLVGHSWGSSLAVEFAARHAALVTHVVNLDGLIFKSPKNERLDEAARRSRAAEIVRTYSRKLADAEEWATFNRSSLPDPSRRVLHHGMFMATDRSAMMQYWRENIIVRLNDKLRAVRCPVLDIHTVAQDAKRGTARAQRRIATLKSLGVSDRVKTVTWFKTGHFVHELRPTDVDGAIASFLEGKPVKDELPSSK